MSEEITEEETIVEEEASFGDAIETTDEIVVEAPTVVETTEPEATETISIEKGEGTISNSIGATGQYYNGPCSRCGARVCNGQVIEGKVNCLTCKADF